MKARSHLTALIKLLFAGLTMSGPGFGAPVEVIAPERVQVVSGRITANLPVCSNHSFDGDHPEIRRIVIGIHGANRRPDVLFEVLRRAAEKDSVSLDSVWIVCPQFLYRNDLADSVPDAGMPYWKYMGWIKGEAAVNLNRGGEEAVDGSSYALLDALIEKLAGQCVNLNEIVVAGHSAGGQTAQRYAACTALASRYNNPGAAELRYVVANPAGYLYLDGRRPVEGEAGRFEVPDSSMKRLCPGYNAWHWGLEAPPAYPARLGAEAMRRQYLSARVALFVGTADTLTNDDGMSGGCAAMLQGRSRIERARNFHAYLQQVLRAELRQRHSYTEIAGVGHNPEAMLGSVTARAVIFRQ